MANFKRKRSYKYAGACGKMCKPWKHGMLPQRERFRPSDRRRLEAAKVAA